MMIVTWNSRLTARNASSTRAGGLRVQLRGRLVGQQDRRGVGQRRGDRHALLFAAGEHAGLVLRTIGEADELEETVDVVLLGHLGPTHGRRETDVVADREVGDEVARRALPDEADPLGSVLREPVLAQQSQVASLHLHDTRRGTVEPAHQVQDRRLAGTARTRRPRGTPRA